MIGYSLILTYLHTCFHQITTACKLCNLILVVGSVNAKFYEPILCLDRTTCDSNLKTLVLQCSCIHKEGIVEVLTCSNGSCTEQVSCLAVVSIKVYGQSLVEHTIVDTYVPCCGCLPCQFVIVCQWAIEQTSIVTATDRIEVVITCTLCIGSGVILSTSILLTCLTPTKAEFQVADSVYILKEAFFLNAPCEGC